jgi:hypothetical protein
VTVAPAPTDPAPEYRGKWVLSVDDYVAATRLLQRNFNRFGTAAGVIALALGLTTAVIFGDVVAGLLAIVAGAGALLVASTPLFDRWRAARLTRSVVGDEVGFIIDAEGISGTMVTGTSRVSWSAVTEIRSDERVIVVMRDRIPIAWMPTSAFASRAEREAVLAFMRSKTAASTGRAQATT